jgi:hypothetical protein
MWRQRHQRVRGKCLELSGKRSALATRAHGRAEARRYVTSRGAIRDNAREPGLATASFVTYGKGHALFAWTLTRSIRDNGSLSAVSLRAAREASALASLFST